MLRDVHNGHVEVRRVAALADVLNWPEAPVILCVDIPIGLLDQAMPGGRECDRAARALLGPSRASSVFPPPIRPVLVAGNYAEACRVSRGSSSHELGLSQQCFAIAPKILEADTMMAPALQDRVVEVHPEVSFHELNGGRPLGSAKKKPEGRTQRLALLEQAWNCELAGMISARPRPSRARRRERRHGRVLDRGAGSSWAGAEAARESAAGLAGAADGDRAVALSPAFHPGRASLATLGPSCHDQKRR